MANALQAASRTAVAQAGAADPFARAAADMGGSMSVYMKFNGNSGEFTVGKEGDEVPEGTELAADMMEFRRGWICWKDNEVIEEIMVRISDGKLPPEEHELTDHGPYVVNEEQNDGWHEQAALSLTNLKTGESYTFKSSSKSANRSLGSLLKDFSRQYKNHPGEIPVVTLGSHSFETKNKAWGKKYAPDLKINRWVKAEDIVVQVEGEDAGDYEDAPPPQAQVLSPPTQISTMVPAQTMPAPIGQPEVTPLVGQTTQQPEPGDKPRPAQRGARRRTF